jgi:flagellar L-ring protein precursor FlgH
MNAGVNQLLGLESSLGRILPGGFDPRNAIGFGGGATSAGSGNITRSEAIKVTIAAVVSHVLPNGNLVIQGRQEVRTNGELRELTVAGIVRPEDITAANTIRHEQIAEARISYGGRGDLSRTQRTPAGQAVLERITPF